MVFWSASLVESFKIGTDHEFLVSHSYGLTWSVEDDPFRDERVKIRLDLFFVQLEALHIDGS